MNTFFKNRLKGFTVIELMIVLMIVAILVALAYPSYVQYARKAKRGEAQQLLMNWAINQEIWRSNHTTYNNTDELRPTHEVYAFEITLPEGQEGSAYILSATASGDQTNDTARNGTSCAVLNLRSDGRKYSDNDETKFSCWD